MTAEKDTTTRRNRILDAAAELFERFGYDKTTVSDIADGAGVSKGAIYLHFESKEELFEALLVQEIKSYVDRLVELVEADPEGGTLATIYRHLLEAQRESPLLEAIYRRDPKVMGSYLYTEGNIVEQTRGSLGFFELMYEAGLIRQELDPKVVTHFMELLRYGILMIGTLQDPETFPPLEEVLGLVQEVVDKSFAPEGGGDGARGVAVLKNFQTVLHEHFEQWERGDEES